jgi:hypothetical protein
VCGTCGRRMAVAYRTRHEPHYSCNHHLLYAH